MTHRDHKPVTSQSQTCHRPVTSDLIALGKENSAEPSKAATAERVRERRCPNDASAAASEHNCASRSEDACRALEMQYELVLLVSNPLVQLEDLARGPRRDFGLEHPLVNLELAERAIAITAPRVGAHEAAVCILA
jgi:hypothetical protein